MFILLFSFALSRLHIIPIPAQVSENPGVVWELFEAMQIGYSSSIKDYGKELAQFISDSIYTPTNIRLQIIESSSVKLGIQLGLCDEDEYQLTIDENLVVINAKNRDLLFNGFQTLLQLLPPQIYCNTTVTQSVKWTAPSVTIRDKPQYKWRGLMVDVCRHFFDVPTIKTIIDSMSHYKFNILHFHLTEDQGWRLNLKKFPNLTKYGSIRDASPKYWSHGGELDGIPYGPFSFTEEDCQEIIEYARMRSITVIPEIEMPGHALGLLCGYPHYSCNGGPFKPRCVWGVEPDIICAGNDDAITFLEQILDEVLRIFPSAYIHCGGDECPRTRWKECPKCQQRMKDEGLTNEDQLQSWFTQHFAKYLEAKGRRFIGWDEILKGDLEFPESAVVMSWLGNADKAAKLGHDVVMTPTSRLYLTWQQFYANEPYEYIGGYRTSYSIYQYNPLSGIPTELTPKIIGVQGCLWAEYIWNITDLQYKAYPRALAIAEIGWEPNESKDWVRFMHDYASHQQQALECMGINDAGLQMGLRAQWNKGDFAADKWVSVQFPVNDALNKNGNIEAAFIYLGGNSKAHVKNVKFLCNEVVIAQDDHEGIVAEDPQNILYNLKTSETVSPDNLKIQADIMCEGGDDCEGLIYLYMK